MPAKAARLPAFGGPEGLSIDEVAVPEPGPGETSGADGSKAARPREFGAEAVFDYRQGDPWQAAREHTGGGGLAPGQLREQRHVPPCFLPGRAVPARVHARIAPRAQSARR